MSKKLIRNLKLDQMMTPSSFMNMVQDMGSSVLFQGCEEMRPRFIMNRKLEMSQECHSKSVEILKDTMRQFDIPLSSSSGESALEKTKSNGVIHPRIGRTP